MHVNYRSKNYSTISIKSSDTNKTKNNSSAIFELDMKTCLMEIKKFEDSLNAKDNNSYNNILKGTNQSVQNP